MRLFLVLLLFLLAAPVVAQTPVFKIEDNTGTALLLVNDDGSITMPTGATNGYVLTTDANGNATWMPASGGGSLTLPFAGTASSASTAFSVENTGTGRGLESTAQATALQVSSALQEGLRVSSAGTRGVFVVSSGSEAFGAQFVGGDGVSIFRAGNPSTTTDSPVNNGFEVDGAEGHGLFVGRADLSGVRVNSTGGNGLSVGSASADGVSVTSAGDDGVFVGSAGGDGVSVLSAGNPSTVNGSALNNGFEVSGTEGHGLFVGQADDDGVRVFSAGNPSTTNSSIFKNGFEVDGAQGHGLYVGRADIDGVFVFSADNNGVSVGSTGDHGVHVGSAGRNGVLVSSAGDDGVHVSSAGNRAGYFNGDVEVTGTLTKGSGTFKIDHPLYPANKYLSHSFVESPDMMNVYNGTVMLDAQGQAVVELPGYFETLNRDFRYQLTCIGGFAPVYIAEEVAGNQFRIAGGTSGLKVSWQVTGIREDPYAEQNRVVVEEDKPLEEQGFYLHPEAYGQPKERGIGHVEAMALRSDEGQR